MITSNQTNHMAISESDLFSLKENYINHIIDSMDMDTLCQYAFDAMMNGTDGIREWDWDDVTEEISDLYGKETLINLLPVAEPSTIG